MPSQRGSPCLSDEQLERAATGAALEPNAQRHLEQCGACHAAVQEIRENNAFLKSFAGRVRTLTRSQELPSLAPDAIPGYRILCELHRGGQGVVYKALQESTKREVAVKVMQEGPFAGLRDKVRFEREVQILGQLNHPNIVTIHDSGQAAGIRYLVMNYIAGQPLDVYLRTITTESLEARDGLPVRPVLELFAEISEAVNAAHLRGIVHRDLKPSNILVDTTGKPHVIDFGLAKLGVAAIGRESVSQDRTLAGQFLGSLAWASPEQAKGDPDEIDIRTDVYSLGVNLYYAFTGCFPYEVEGNLPEVLDNILKAAPVRPRVICPQIDDEIETIVLKCLQKEPRRRYQSAGELARDLRHYLAGEPIDAKRDSTWYVLRKTAGRLWLPLMIASTFVMLVLAFAVGMAVLARQAAQQRDAARQERTRADENAEQLARTLHATNIERGRMMGLNGNMAIAEELVWRTLLAASPRATELDVAQLAADNDTRQAYWALWELYRREPCLLTVQAHNDAVQSIVFTDQGHTILSASPAALVRTAVRTPARAKTLLSFDDSSTRDRVCLSADGKLLARVRDVGAGELWSVETLQQVGSLICPQTRVSCLEFDREGTYLAAGTVGGEIVLWDTHTGRKVATLTEDANAISSVKFVPGGRKLVSVSNDGSVRVWDWAHGTVTARTEVDRFRGSPALAVSPDGQTAALGGTRALDLCRLADLRPVLRLQQQPAPAGGMIFAGDGRILAAACADRVLRLWDTQEGKLLREFSGHHSLARAVALTPDGSAAATADESGVVKLWELAGTGGLERLGTGEGSTHVVRFSPDGRLLASAGRPDHTARAVPSPIELWEVDSRTRWTALEGHMGVVSEVVFLPGGAQVVSSGHDHTIRLWDIATGAQVGALPGHERAINHIAISPTGDLLASASDDCTVRLWELQTGRLIDTLRFHQERVPSVAFSPDGRTLASAGMDAAVVLWDISSRTVRAVLRGHERGVRAVRFSPDGRILATGGDDWTVRLWETSSGDCLRILQGHRGTVFALAFRGDGVLLASGDRESVIQLWEVRTGRNLAMLDTDAEDVMSLDFSPDMDTLAAAYAGGGGVGLWDLRYFERHIAGNRQYLVSRVVGGGRVGVAGSSSAPD